MACARPGARPGPGERARADRDALLPPYVPHRSTATSHRPLSPSRGPRVRLQAAGRTALRSRRAAVSLGSGCALCRVPPRDQPRRQALAGSALASAARAHFRRRSRGRAPVGRRHRVSTQRADCRGHDRRDRAAAAHAAGARVASIARDARCRRRYRTHALCGRSGDTHRRVVHRD